MKLTVILVLCIFLINESFSSIDEKAFETLIERVKSLEKIVTTLVEPLDQRVEKLEEISKIKNLRNCKELSEKGLSKSGSYNVDPDGDGQGFGPIAVYCDFMINTTSIYYGKEDVPAEQIQALIDLSESCDVTEEGITCQGKWELKRSMSAKLKRRKMRERKKVGLKERRSNKKYECKEEAQKVGA